MEAREHSAATQECQPMSIQWGGLIHSIVVLQRAVGLQRPVSFAELMNLQQPLITAASDCSAAGYPCVLRNATLKTPLGFKLIFSSEWDFRGSLCRFDES